MKKNRKWLLLLAALLTGSAGMGTVNLRAEELHIRELRVEEPEEEAEGEELGIDSLKEDTTLKSELQRREEAAELIPYFEKRYFLSRLEGEELEDFCAMYRCMTEFAEECELPNPISGQTVNELLVYLNYECPELLQYESDETITFWTSDRTGLVVKVRLPYAMDRSGYEQMRGEAESRLDALCAQTAGMSDYEKELFFYRYIIENCHYNRETENAANAYGVLVEGQGRCEGISRTIKWAMDKLDIPNFILRGIDEADPTNNHSWNVIQIGDTYGDLDATQDDAESADDGTQLPVPYGLVNVSADWLRSRYRLDDANLRFELPGSESMEKSYHALQGTLVREGESAREMLKSLLWQAYGNGGATFSFQVENRETWQDMVANIENYVNSWGYDNQVAQWNYNWYTYEPGQVIVLCIAF